jgi:hypothetical protein
MTEARLPIERIEYFIQLESFAVLIVALLIGWIFYKLFLKKITEKRHASLRHKVIRTSFTGESLRPHGLIIFH